MLGLTTLGIIHTSISLVAVISGFWSLARYKEISTRALLGRVYLITTLLTALTGLGIFQHGGFGPPHALSILTLLALAVGTAATFTALFASWSRYVQAISFSTTMLFHMIPGFTESLTRLPSGQPVLPSADAPEFRFIYGALLLLFVIGLILQFRWLRANPSNSLVHAHA